MDDAAIGRAVRWVLGNPQVFLVSENRFLTLQISDSGVGFDTRRVKAGGLGLVSMR